MSARVYVCIQRLTTWRCPQQRAFKNIYIRAYTGSSFLPEHLKNGNKQLLVTTIHESQHTLQNVPQLQAARFIAHSTSLYSSDSGNTPTNSGGEGKQNSTMSGEVADNKERHPDAEKEPLPEWPDGVNPHTGEKGGPKGPEPTRYGDWERKGRVSDF